jgi:hypothetical protein
MLTEAYEGQIAELEEAEGEGSSLSKELRNMLAAAKKTNCAKADKEAAKDLKEWAEELAA